MRLILPRSVLYPVALWLGLALGQAAGAQSIPLRYYDQDQGLLGLAGTCLYQARGGTVLVCTESGLYRFNGRDFSQVPLQGKRGHMIDAITQDTAARLWIASTEHLYVGSLDALRRLEPQETGPLKEGSLMLASPGWGTVLINDGRALYAQPQPNGRWQLQPLFDAATLARVPQLRKIVSAQAEGQTLWLGCNGALCRIGADRSVQVLDQAQGLPPDIWRSVAHDRNDGLWVRGMNQVMELPAGAARFVPRPVPGVGLGMFSLQAQILRDGLGRIVLRTDTGLARWEDQQWRVFDHRNGLPHSAISTLLFDQQGDLWMTVSGEGLIRWTGYEWIENWDGSQGMANPPTWSIQRDPAGAMLLGNEGGVSRQRPGTASFAPWIPAAGHQIVGLQVTADGAVWTANSLRQLYRHDADGTHGRQVAQLDGATKGSYLDHAGRLWILTQQGVYVSPRPLDRQPPQRVQALPIDSYTDLIERGDGTVLVSGAAGVYRFDGARWTRLKLSLDGKPAQPWVDKLLVLEDGHAWASLSSPGLWEGHLQGDTLALRQVQDPQLAELRAYLIRRDHAGRIWVGHDQGVEVYNGRQWSRLTQSQGLLWDDTAESAYFEDGDGSVWIGNSRGVSHILDPSRLFDSHSPALTLTGFTRAHTTITAGARLPWSEDPLHIQVATPPLYEDRNRVRLRYRFGGLHSQWIDTPNFQIDQPPLSPGDYVLEIQLLDSYRRSSSPVIKVAFSIAPVWWRSEPMLGLYVVLGAGLVVLLWRFRHRQLRRRERVLGRLVAQRTQELEQDKRELERARAALAVKASHDPLTGLPNRAAALEALAAQIQAQTRTGKPLAVAMIDLDHFKRINDAHGHQVGDAVLSHVGRRLKAALRGDDLIGRYGGEELLGILPGLPLASHAPRLQSLLEAISDQPVRINGCTIKVTASIGVAWYQPGETLEQVLSRADTAMYQAKHLGRNRIELHGTAPPAKPAQGAA
jgi:diguanylate cyclase (GGDEF)-like protein